MLNALPHYDDTNSAYCTQKCVIITFCVLLCVLCWTMQYAWLHISIDLFPFYHILILVCLQERSSVRKTLSVGQIENSI